MYMVTRRTLERRYMLRPGKKVKQILAYCLAEAAQRFQIDVVLPMALSNHHHTIVYDRHGNIIQFVEHLHKMIAKCLNAMRGRHDYVWSCSPPGITELADPGAFFEKLVYVATNPVKHHLVERVHHWPGFNGVSELLNQQTITVERPTCFFRKNSRMPASVTLTMAIPPEFDSESILMRLRERIAEVEAMYATERLRTGRRVVGRHNVLTEDWKAAPTTVAPPCEIRPRVAASNRDVRIEVLARNASFVRAYRRAYASLGTDTPVPFPIGTYRLHKKVRIPPTISLAS
ncbi:MAG: hypothetical protein ABI867_30545 [Kofleriaceae bacterium]